MNWKNCAHSSQVITLLNMSLIVNGKCEVSSTSCSNIQPYKSAMVCHIYCTKKISNLFFIDGNDRL